MSDALQMFLDSVTSGDDARTEEAALALAHEYEDEDNAGDAVLLPLLDLLTNADPDHRWWAVRALAAIGTQAAREQLIAALADPDPDVRACAAQGLGELRATATWSAETVVASLVRCMADPVPLVSRIAADSLARIGPPAVPALITALQAEETPVRAGAARALSIIQPKEKVKEAIPALCAALDDPSAIVTYYAEQALERMGVGMVFFRP